MIIEVIEKHHQLCRGIKPNADLQQQQQQPSSSSSTSKEMPSLIDMESFEEYDSGKSSIAWGSAANDTVTSNNKGNSTPLDDLLGLDFHVSQLLD
jgi:hypothetical protein